MSGFLCFCFFMAVVTSVIWLGIIKAGKHVMKDPVKGQKVKDGLSNLAVAMLKKWL